MSRVTRIYNIVSLCAQCAVVLSLVLWGQVAGWTSINIGLAAFHGGWLLTDHHKEKRNGSNRGTEASAHDSDAEGDSDDSFHITINNPGAFSISPGSFLTTIDAPSKPPTPDAEKVESDMPILAHRVARLRFDGTDKPFGPLHYGKPFGRDAKARCEQSDPYGMSFAAFGIRPSVPQRHKAPSLGCNCGYYALPSDLNAWEEGHDYVTLMVELSGTVIEHEKGYRASHQRVVECQIPACRYCGRKASVLDLRGGQMYAATCGYHIATVAPDENGDGRVLLSVTDIALPVPVTFLGRES